ncbi:hypothetical protein D3C81_1961530 [compost metagenome]
MFLLLALQSIAQLYVKSLLKERYPDKVAEYGSIKAMISNRLRNLGDSELSRACQGYRLLVVFYYASFLLSIFLFIKEVALRFEAENLEICFL